jgi:hypothetical protein
MHGTNHEFEILLDHPNGTNFLAPNAPYYNNDEYSKNDPNKNQQFDFDNDMENLDLSQSLYGDLNAIPNSTTIAKNLIASLSHVVPIIFHRMDPIALQARMKDLCDAPHANSILQHFTTTFTEFNMLLVRVEMIVTATTDMD